MSELVSAGVPFTPRGAGTGLSGGALALNQGVVVEMARMRKILQIDEANRLAIVQPGVVNSHVSRAVAHLNLHYVPDPSSQPTCTIGGNIAENAGGIHCLKYGTTTDHVVGLKVVLAGGEVVDLRAESPGYDLLGTFIGSEGTFGIATEATLRLTPIPPTVRTLLAEFEDVDDATRAVSAIIAGGVMPAALEMMDREIIRAVEASVFAAGLSQDVGGALLIELDGIQAGIDDEAERVKTICLEHGARTCRSATDEAERKKLWAARKSAFGAVSRISPDSMIQDAVVPRSRLPEVLADAYRISSKYQLRLANVFHAGDGNLHPLICFDSRFEDQVKRVKEAGRELMETCVRAGGSITGEHGVGYDKRELISLIFSEDDLETMLRVRAAFDETGLCNPGKIVPMLRGCGEGRLVASTNNGGPKAVTSELPITSWPAKTERITQRSATKFDIEKAGSQLQRVIGYDNVSMNDNALVVSPPSIALISEVMKLASSEGWTVQPAGAMTWLAAGNSQRSANIILSSSNLRRVIEHEPADLITVTEAGVPLSNLNDELSKNGQWLPIDPPDDGRATVGGIVATGLGGAQQFGYGLPRRHVIGMKVVLADGTMVKVGGKVVKNVAGYDLSKLFTGSYGTLGVITEVNFKLRPVPIATRTVVAAGDIAGLLSAGRRIMRNRLFPVAAELLSAKLASQLVVGDGTQHVLLLRFAGSDIAVAEQARASALELKNLSHTLIENDVQLWKTIAEIPYKFSEAFIFRIGVRPTEIEQFLPEGNGTEIWQAGIGDGRVRVIDFRDETDEVVNDALRLRVEAEKLRGSLMIESASAGWRSRIDTWGSLGDTTTLMERIKLQLDPQRILSPGRFNPRV